VKGGRNYIAPLPRASSTETTRRRESEKIRERRTRDADDVEAQCPAVSNPPTTFVSRGSRRGFDEGPSRRTRCRHAEARDRASAISTRFVAQGGPLLKTNPPGGPFTGFQIRRVLLAGCSEQGLLVKMYMRDSHCCTGPPTIGRFFDGYFPACVADWPVIVRLDDGTIVRNFASPPVDVPVINFATQAEPESWPQDGRLYRRPDIDFPNDLFRLYEVAGMPHGLNTRRTSGTVTCAGVAQEVSRFPGAHIANYGLDSSLSGLTGASCHRRQTAWRPTDLMVRF